MYQFTQMMGDLQPRVKRSYCWRGLGLAMVGGWLPAWGLCHWQDWGGWAFAGLWALSLPLGYFIGKRVKK